VKSDAKTRAARRNGKKGGRPRKPVASLVRYTPTAADRWAAQARAPKRPLPDSKIDFSEIPEASDEWLAQAVRDRAARLRGGGR
jgi:hypothetical protein